MSAGSQLDRANTVLVVVDVQERLMTAMDPALREKAVKNLGILCDAMTILNVPTLVTEQYPQGLGRTIPEVRERVRSGPIEKIVFSCCKEERFTKALEFLKRPAILLAGVETHVCVLQTCLDLLDTGHIVHVVRNAVASRTHDDWSNGLTIMERAGAWITTTETAVFQLLGRAGTDEFKKISQLVK